LAFWEWRLINRAGLKFDGQSWPFMNGGRSFRQDLNLMGRVGLSWMEVDQLGRPWIWWGRVGLWWMEVDRSGRTYIWWAELAFCKWRSIVQAGLKVDGQGWPFVILFSYAWKLKCCEGQSWGLPCIEKICHRRRLKTTCWVAQVVSWFGPGPIGTPTTQTTHLGIWLGNAGRSVLTLSKTLPQNWNLWYVTTKDLAFCWPCQQGKDIVFRFINREYSSLRDFGP
jgi:hypothetical protein